MDLDLTDAVRVEVAAIETDSDHRAAVVTSFTLRVVLTDGSERTWSDRYPPGSGPTYPAFTLMIDRINGDLQRRA